MKSSSICRALGALIAVRQPVFVWGGPGIGKSAIVHQLAENLGIRLRMCERYYSIQWIYVACLFSEAMVGPNGQPRNFCLRMEQGFCFWMN
ncbi:MAG TPA: hypothetical protein VM912_16745 [Terriglobales bacterium]|nr:hypothetical protein [Terriglobales bacterium]